MRWSELSLDGPNPTWTIPAERSKNRRPHTVPLTAAVLALLPERILGCDFVFSRRGRVPLNGIAVAKAQLDAAMRIPAWTVHDLRRTFVTGANGIGVQPHVIEATINHISGAAKSGVAGIYNRSTYAPEKREALTRWSDHVAALVGDNVHFLTAAE